MKKIVAVLLLFLLASLSLRAANAFPANARVTQVTLGQSVVALNGPWKFHIGDNPKWADPNFDDSAWQDYTVDSKQRTLSVVQLLQSKAMPGWQRHGHPGYTGYAWYRIRLQAPPHADSLALLMPQHVDDGYEVYVNGQKIGSFGKLDGWHLTYTEQPKLFSISARVLKGGQPIALAIRFWNSRYEGVVFGEHNLDGGLRGVPLLGPPELLRVFQQSVQERIGQTSWHLRLFIPACGAVGIISLFLFVFSRRLREYLWAGISLTSLAVVAAATAVEHAQQTSIPFQLADAIAFVAYCAGFFALPLAAMYLLGVPRPLWRRVNYVVFAVDFTYGLVVLGMGLGFLPPTIILDRIYSLSLPPYLPFIFLLVAITVDGLRTIGRKAWVLLTPGVLFVFYLILSRLFASTGRFLLITEVVSVGVPMAVLVIFLMRFTDQQRENIRLFDDMKQAREVQQVLIPEELPQIPGLTIESEYRPAREVGGDFFQIVPHTTDGSVLIVVGDVTGKGLQAGMLVALIVGAIRNETAHTFDPLAALNALNQALCGRGHAHATCLALRIAADGSATLANAGHLPPYLNGKELPMEGALPLGMAEDAKFSVMHFQLAPGDRLLLLSDGVAEAQDEKGQLFGFERISKLLQKPISAAEVAAAAQAFGQEDDISVLSVTRTANLKAVPA